MNRPAVFVLLVTIGMLVSILAILGTVVLVRLFDIFAYGG